MTLTIVTIKSDRIVYIDMKNNEESGSVRPEISTVRQTSIGWMLKLLSFNLDNKMLEGLKPLGLNISHFSIIMVLLEEDNISQSAIGKKVLMASYATTRNIDALEKRGIVERHRDQASRRTFNIRLTKKGIDLADTLTTLVQNINQELLQPLDKAEQEILKKLLPKLTQIK